MSLGTLVLGGFCLERNSYGLARAESEVKS
jgi:hypothetical protein